MPQGRSYAKKSSGSSSTSSGRKPRVGRTTGVRRTRSRNKSGNNPRNR